METLKVHMKKKTDQANQLNCLKQDFKRLNLLF